MKGKCLVLISAAVLFMGRALLAESPEDYREMQWEYGEYFDWGGPPTSTDTEKAYHVDSNRFEAKAASSKQVTHANVRRVIEQSDYISNEILPDAATNTKAFVAAQLQCHASCVKTGKFSAVDWESSAEPWNNADSDFGLKMSDAGGYLARYAVSCECADPKLVTNPKAADNKVVGVTSGIITTPNLLWMNQIKSNDDGPLDHIPPVPYTPPGWAQAIDPGTLVYLNTKTLSSDPFDVWVKATVSRCEQKLTPDNSGGFIQGDIIPRPDGDMLAELTAAKIASDRCAAKGRIAIPEEAPETGASCENGNDHYVAYYRTTFHCI